MRKGFTFLLALVLATLLIPAVASAHTLKKSTAKAQARALVTALREDPEVVQAGFERCRRVDAHRMNCALWLEHVQDGTCSFEVSVRFRSQRSHRVVMRQLDRSFRCVQSD